MRLWKGAGREEKEDYGPDWSDDLTMMMKGFDYGMGEHGIMWS